MLKVWRCRWCGRRVHGIFGWFHQPDRCKDRIIHVPDCPCGFCHDPEFS